MSQKIQLEKFSSVQTAEHHLIRQQRKLRQEEVNGDKHTGISISGGGIRSASLALGVLQALYSEKVLPKIDYLSTVSGGGYIGSSWTWFNHLKQQGKLGDIQKGYFFPFGKQEEGSRSVHSSIENKILSFLRQHASYLVPGDGLNYFSGFAVVMRNMLLPLLVYISLLVVMFTGAIWFEQSAMQPVTIETGITVVDSVLTISEGTIGKRHNLFTTLSLITTVTTIVAGFIYGPVSFLFSRTTLKGYRIRTIFQQTMGYGVIASLAFGFIGALPFLIVKIEDTIPTTLSGFVGILGATFHFVQLNRGKKLGVSSNIVAIVSALLMIIAIFCLAYGLASSKPHMWMYALPASLLPGLLVNLNLFGLGRMYRDRLIETFMPNPTAVESQQWELATEAATTQLRNVSTEKDQGPYHLINTNLILVNSANNKYKGRGGDNFLLSSLYCGSDATDWVPTEQFNGGDLTLGTAMATSGAAVNPHAGPDSRGITNNPLVSFLMYILGLRMGLNVLNPDRKHGKLSPPNLFFPGLQQGLLGLGFNNKSKFLTLSDGGHFENTATYELIRRQTDTIILSEGGQDQNFSFEDIANLIEKVRVDFGVHIRFKKDYGIDALVPDSIKEASQFDQRYQMAERGFAIADIKYPKTRDSSGKLQRKSGLLFVVKATMTRDLPADLYGYKDANPAFPNQTTMDQFFDEVQSEAYRELGYQLGKQMTANKTFREAFSLCPPKNNDDCTAPSPEHHDSQPQPQSDKQKQES